MNNESKSSKLFYLTSYFLICIGLFLSFFGIYKPYSYWWDELFSVIASSSQLSVMFSDFILPDVHPPLYQLALKGWMYIFSSSEVSTRLLSLLFSGFAFFMLVFWGKRKLPKIAFITTLVVFSTNNLFIYYSQETRSYTMMLFFATALTIFFIGYNNPDERNFKHLLGILVISSMLSLTHYFGLFYACIILIYLFLLSIQGRKFQMCCKILITGLFCMAWPVYHYLYGEIRGKMGGNFWIKSEGWQNTMENASDAIFPQISIGFSKIFFIDNQDVNAIFFIILFSILFFLAYTKSKKENNHSLPTDEINAAVGGNIIIIVSFLVLIVFIDFYSPLSTTRNFIVLLPAVSIIIGIAANNLFHMNKIILYLLVLLFAGSNIALFAISYSSKHGRVPNENYKEAAKYIIEYQQDKDYHVYYLDRISDGDANDRNARFYLDQLNPGKKIEIKGVTNEELFLLKKPYLLFIQHNQEAYHIIMEKLNHNNIEYYSYLPEQRALGAVVIRVE